MRERRRPLGQIEAIACIIRNKPDIERINVSPPVTSFVKILDQRRVHVVIGRQANSPHPIRRLLETIGIAEFRRDAGIVFDLLRPDGKVPCTLLKAIVQGFVIDIIENVAAFLHFAQCRKLALPDVPQGRIIEAEFRCHLSGCFLDADRPHVIRRPCHCGFLRFMAL